MPSRARVALPIRAGDVLILGTERTFTAYVVGRVTTDGQSDFCGQRDTHVAGGRTDALALGARLYGPIARTFLVNIDANAWEQIGGPITRSPGADE